MPKKVLTPLRRSRRLCGQTPHQSEAEQHGQATSIRDSGVAVAVSAIVGLEAAESLEHSNVKNDCANDSSSFDVDTADRRIEGTASEPTSSTAITNSLAESLAAAAILARNLAGERLTRECAMATGLSDARPVVHQRENVHIGDAVAPSAITCASDNGSNGCAGAAGADLVEKAERFDEFTDTQDSLSWSPAQVGSQKIPTEVDKAADSEISREFRESREMDSSEQQGGDNVQACVGQADAGTVSDPGNDEADLCQNPSKVAKAVDSKLSREFRESGEMDSSEQQGRDNVQPCVGQADAGTVSDPGDDETDLCQNPAKVVKAADSEISWELSESGEMDSSEQQGRDEFQACLRGAEVGEATDISVIRVIARKKKSEAVPATLVKDNEGVFKVPSLPEPIATDGCEIPGIMEVDNPAVNKFVAPKPMVNPQVFLQESLSVEKGLTKIETVFTLAGKYLESLDASSKQIKRTVDLQFRNMSVRLKQLSAVADFLLNMSRRKRLEHPTAGAHSNLNISQSTASKGPKSTVYPRLHSVLGSAPFSAPRRTGLLGHSPKTAATTNSYDVPVRQECCKAAALESSDYSGASPSDEKLDTKPPDFDFRPPPWKFPDGSSLRKDWEVAIPVFAWQGMWHPFSLNHPFEFRIGDLAFVSMLQAYYFFKCKIMKMDDLATQVKATNLFLVPELRLVVPGTDRTGLWGRKMRTRLLRRLTFLKYEQCSRFKACVDTVEQLRLVAYDEDDELCAGLTLDAVRADPGAKVGKTKGKNIYGQLLTHFVKQMQSSKESTEEVEQPLDVTRYASLDSFDDVVLANKKALLLHPAKVQLRGIFRTFSPTDNEAVELSCSEDPIALSYLKTRPNPTDFGCIVLFPGFTDCPRRGGPFGTESQETWPKTEDFVSFLKSMRSISATSHFFVVNLWREASNEQGKARIVNDSLSTALKVLNDPRISLIDIETAMIESPVYLDSEGALTSAGVNRLLEVLAGRLPFLNIDYIFATDSEVWKFLGPHRIAQKPVVEEQDEPSGEGSSRKPRKRKRGIGNAAEIDEADTSPKRSRFESEDVVDEGNAPADPSPSISKEKVESSIETANKVKAKLEEFLAARKAGVKAKSNFSISNVAGHRPGSAHLPPPGLVSLVDESELVNIHQNAGESRRLLDLPATSLGSGLPQGIQRLGTSETTSTSSATRLPTVAQIKAMTDIVSYSSAAPGQDAKNCADGAAVKKAKEALVKMLKAYNVSPEEVQARKAAGVSAAIPVQHHLYSQPPPQVTRPPSSLMFQSSTVVGSNLVQEALKSSSLKSRLPGGVSLSEKDLSILESAAMALAQSHIIRASDQVSPMVTPHAIVPSTSFPGFSSSIPPPTLVQPVSLGGSGNIGQPFLSTPSSALLPPSVSTSVAVATDPFALDRRSALSTSSAVLQTCSPDYVPATVSAKLREPFSGKKYQELDLAQKRARILAAAKSKMAVKPSSNGPNQEAKFKSSMDRLDEARELVKELSAGEQKSRFSPAESCRVSQRASASPGRGSSRGVTLTPDKQGTSSSELDRLCADFLASQAHDRGGSRLSSEVRPGSPEPNEPDEPCEAEDERMRAIKELERKLAELKGEVERVSKDPKKSIPKSVASDQAASISQFSGSKLDTDYATVLSSTSPQSYGAQSRSSEKEASAGANLSGISDAMAAAIAASYSGISPVAESRPLLQRFVPPPSFPTNLDSQTGGSLRTAHSFAETGDVSTSLRQSLAKTRSPVFSASEVQQSSYESLYPAYQSSLTQHQYSQGSDVDHMRARSNMPPATTPYDLLPHTRTYNGPLSLPLPLGEQGFACTRASQQDVASNQRLPTMTKSGVLSPPRRHRDDFEPGRRFDY